MYTVTIKRLINKEMGIVPFWKSMLNVFLIYVNVVNHAPHGCYLLIVIS
jgi:hypothetical protein